MYIYFQDHTHNHVIYVCIFIKQVALRDCSNLLYENTEMLGKSKLWKGTLYMLMDTCCMKMRSSIVDNIINTKGLKTEMTRQFYINI